MRNLRVFMMALGLAALTIQAEASVWQETQITSGFSQWRGSPRLWQDKLYYGDMGNTDISDVYLWTQAQGSVRILGGDGISRAPVGVWDNNLVISRVESGQHKLYLYDGIHAEQPVATSAGNKENADIYQNTVVYEDHSGTYSQVMIWDAVNGSRPVSSANAGQINPKIWGEGAGQRVVWQQSGGVWMWTPSAGTTRLATGQSPVVYGDKVVFFYPATQDYLGFHTGSIRQWTSQGGFQDLATWWNYSGPFEVGMSDSLVAWSLGDPRYASTYDPANGVRLLTDMTPAMIGSTYGNSVAWVGNYNIYVSTLVPEPSSLLALGSLAGALMLMRRRKPLTIGGEE